MTPNQIPQQSHRTRSSVHQALNKAGNGLFSFETARQTLHGFEMMNTIRKGQVQGTEKSDVQGQVALITGLFGVAV